jgi:DNA-binding transcriptional regulator YbjK
VSRPDTHREATLARRQALLDAAVEVVAERGVGGATHREIASRAGLPLSTTSYFFDSIDELLLEAMRVFTGRLLSELEVVRAILTGQELPPIEAVDALLEVLMAQPQARIVAQFETYLEATRREEVREEVRHLIEALEAVAAAGLAAAGARNPTEGARAFVALLDGSALHRVAWPRRRGDREVLREAMIDLFVAQTLDDRERAELRKRAERAPTAAR